MYDQLETLIPIAAFVVGAAVLLSIRLPVLFVSMFVAYHLFKSLIRAYAPVLSYGYTVDVAVALIALSGAYFHWRRHRHESAWGNAPKRLLVIYGVFLLLMLLTYPLTNAPGGAVKKLLIFGVMTPFCILIPSLYLQRLRDVHSLLVFLFGWGVLAAVMTLFFGVNVVEDTGATRMSAGYASTLLVTSIVANGAIASLASLMRANKLPLLFVPVAVLVFVYTGTRGPVVLMLVPILYILFVMRLKRIWIPSALFPILALIFLYLIRLMDVSAGMTRFGAMSEGVSGRMAMINEVMHGSSTFDLIIGGGVGNTSYILTGRDEWAYPHNSVVEVWAELGLLGLFLLCWLFGWFSIAALRLRSECREHLRTLIPVAILAGIGIFAILGSLKMNSFFACFDVWFFIAATLVCRQRFVAHTAPDASARFAPLPHAGYSY